MAEDTSRPSTIDGAIIFSNKENGKAVDIRLGISELSYFESILSDTVNVEILYADSGDTIDNKGLEEGLPLVGSETFALKFTDANGVSLLFGDVTEEKEVDHNKNYLYVKKPSVISRDGRKSMQNLHLTSKEFILNDKVRVNQRFDGSISETVKKIFEDQNYLNMKDSEKKVNIEPTLNEYNFTSNNWKPQYILNWLSKKSVSREHQQNGKSAGYFFYETGGTEENSGYHFKSIDGLFEQTPKKKIIYTEGTLLPEGYDTKALSYKKSLSDSQKQYSAGTYSTRTITFDPFNCYYRVETPNSQKLDEDNGYKKGGKNLLLQNSAFIRDEKYKEFSNTKYFVLDTGVIPTGDSAKEQLEESTSPNFEYAKIANQAQMRYNQFFSFGAEIVIKADYDLHVGDAVFLDIPQLNYNKTDDVDKESGGLYIITGLCHHIQDEHSYTKLTLFSDSTGRDVNKKN